VSVTADAARSLAIALAGQSGREIVTVVGHLTMAQDRPPRVRVRTQDDDYVAGANTEEMLDRVKELLFDEVRATLVIDMRTSPSTGSPDVNIELMELEPAETRPQEIQPKSDWPSPRSPRERGEERLG
jgi:nucleotide-binding universal stress UspA family protein